MENNENECIKYYGSIAAFLKEKEMAMVAVQQGCSLDPIWRLNKEVMMHAVKQDGWALQLVDYPLRLDKEITIAAVEQDGSALQYADPIFTSDKKVVMIAVKKDGHAFRFADAIFGTDKDVVMAAVRQDGDAFHYADEELKSNEDFIAELLITNIHNPWICEDIWEHIDDDINSRYEIWQNLAMSYYGINCIKDRLEDNYRNTL